MRDDLVRRYQVGDTARCGTAVAGGADVDLRRCPVTQPSEFDPLPAFEIEEAAPRISGLPLFDTRLTVQAALYRNSTPSPVPCRS